MPLIRDPRAGAIMLLSVIAERGTLQPPAPAQVPPRLPPQVAYQRLDSLERVALTAATFNERLHATSTIARPGMPDRGDCQRSAGNSPSEIRYPGIVDGEFPALRWQSD